MVDVGYMRHLGTSTTPWWGWVSQRIAFRNGHEKPNSVCQVWNSHGWDPTASGLWFQLQAVWLSFVSPGAQKVILVSEHGGYQMENYDTPFFFLNIAIHYEHGGIPLGYHGGIPWGYHIFRKNRSWPSKLELLWCSFRMAKWWMFHNLSQQNTLEPQIWYRRWYPRGFATNVWENMDDINRDMRDTVWDTGW